MSELEVELRALVTRSESRADDASRNDAGCGSLSDQVVKWGEAYFTQAD